ncbi:MAG: 60S ribosomal protein L36 [Chrysothrix sp. TS-e1954]|nr:MAG: 60S ribosomal protein L36 [Chrysothrix sp. TS-e1954]
MTSISIADCTNLPVAPNGIANAAIFEQKITPIKPPTRISKSKGRVSKRTQFVRDIVKEVSGLAPYERRVIELLRNSKDKRARKLAKKRLGTHGRAKRKVDEMTKVIAESRRAAH